MAYEKLNLIDGQKWKAEHVEHIEDGILNVEKELDNYVEKEEGKGLSSNDYSTVEKTKLSEIEEGANKTNVDSTLSDTSSNPLQNKVVKAELDKKANTNHGIHVIEGGTVGQVLKKTASGYEWAKDNDTVYTHPTSHPATMITEDSSHRFVSDNEKNTWNGKAEANHNHDDRYYTEAEVDNKLNTKANSSHVHSTSDITGLEAYINEKIGVIASSLDEINGEVV